MQISPNAPEDLIANLATPIALGIHTQGQKHVALIYNHLNSDLSDQHMLLHLGWHKTLYYDYWDAQYNWLNFNIESIDEEVQATFGYWAALVGGTGKQTQEITYSLKFSGNQHFDRQSGKYLTQNNGAGLTCATFLLALFNDFGIPLVDYKSWPIKRIGDLEATRDLFKKLLDREVKKLRTMTLYDWKLQWTHRHHLARFRPEEVFVTASLFNSKPLSFEDVEQAGELVLTELRRSP